MSLPLAIARAAPTSSASPSRPSSASTCSTRCCAGRTSDGPGLAADRPLRRRPARADQAGRPLHGAGLHQPARLPDPRRRADRAPHLPGVARAARAEGQDWKAYARSLVVFSLFFWVALYLILRTQGIQPFNPEGFHSGALGPQLQHRLLLRHQHQLAVLRRRNDAHLLRPDGRADGAELRLRRGRDRRRRRPDPRHRRPQRQRARQLLAGPGPHPPLRPAAALDRRRPLPRLPGGDPEPRRRAASSRPSPAATRSSARARSPRRRRSRSSAPTAAASSTSTRPIPFENPSGLTNFVELLLILVIPAALTYTYGRMVGSQRQGWAIFAAMFGALRRRRRRRLPGRAARHPAQHAAGLHTARLRRLDRRQHGGQGAALRDRRAPRSGRRSTTVTSCGAVNAAFESLTGLGGAVPFANLGFSEVVFGGVGTGLYSMLLYVLLAVFIGGLMVGRTPEYLGKKIRRAEIKLVSLGVLVTPLTVLLSSGLASRRAAGKRSIYAGSTRRASRRRSTPTSRRPTTTAPPSPATPASSSPTRPATSAPTGSPSPTCSAAR